MDIAKLKLELQEVAISGDVAKILEVANKIKLAEVEEVKAKAAKAKAEFDAKATLRQEIATELHKAVIALPSIKRLAEVAATGFTFKLDTPAKAATETEPAVEAVKHLSVALTVAGIKAPKAGNGGYQGGKTKDEYGMSLGDVFEKFADNDERTKLAAATSNSTQWQVKVAVKKRAIAEGLLIVQS